MPLKNDFSIDTIVLDSQIRGEDFSNRVISSTGRGRSNLLNTMQQWQANHAAKSVFRFPLDTPKYYMTIDISEYSRNNLFSLNFNSKQTIILPIPNQLVTQNDVSYSEEDIGLLTGGITQAALTGIEMSKNSQSTSQTLQDSANELSSLYEQFKDNPSELLRAILLNQKGLSQGLLAAIGKGLLPKGAENALGAITGYSPNQFFTVLLRGPTYNQYQFLWYLMPRNLRESNQIKDICNILNNAKAPSLAFGGLLWGFPKVFQLAYYPNSQYLNKFKPSVMTSLQINFAPGGSPAFYATNGTPNPPEAVVIAASFKEMEYWLEGDYIDSNNPFETQGPR